MLWPPVMAWTTLIPYKEEIHFVAINYGLERNKRWVDLVAVLDGDVCLRVLYKDLDDSTQWLPGWIEEKRIISNMKKISSLNEDPSLYPSNDSGLLLPITKEKFRPWFP